MIRTGDVVDGTYRIDALIASSPRAHVFAVAHLQYPEVPLAMKVAALPQTQDFERDTAALASLASPSVARMFDRGKLPDGRLYRVVQRLAGPTLRDALAASPFSPARAMELVVQLSTAVHEAHDGGIGPCDVSPDNLVFRDGTAGQLCMLRVLAPHERTPGADLRALSVLRHTLDQGSTRAWKPPSSLKEIRAAIAETGGPRSPDDSEPGTSIQRWEVVSRLSETLRATVYRVTGKNGLAGVLKVAGPEANRDAFLRHAQALSKVQSRHVVRVLDVGRHEETPYVVMEPLHVAYARRLEDGPFAIDIALQIVDELLWGADAIERAGASPSDFALDHAWQATSAASPSVLTHAMAPLGRFRAYGRPQGGDRADAWSAAVALYELLAGRLPFPTSKHSLAKAWMGMPVPLGQRRRDVPADISDLVHEVLVGGKMKTAELRREITRIRSAPATIRPPSIPPAPVASRAPPPPRASVVPTAPLVPRASVAPASPPASLPPLSRGTARLATRPPPVDFALELLPERCPLGTLAAATFTADGRGVVAVGAGAVARYRAGVWTMDPAREAVRALTPMPGGGALAITTRGTLAHVPPSGAMGPWGVTLERFAFAAALADGEGFLLMGKNDRQQGVVARLEGESIAILADALDTPPLRAGALLPDRTLLAAADGGRLVRIQGRTVVGSLQLGADLVAVGAALAVGTQAFAIATAPTLHATAEPMEGTATVLVTRGDHAWVGTTDGRLLARTERAWKRVEPAFESAVLALFVGEQHLGGVLADGRLVLGRPRA